MGQDADARWHLDTPWDELTKGVRAGYEELIRTIGPIAPSFANGYDNILRPSTREVRRDRNRRPWVWKHMKKAGIPPEKMSELARLMMTWFNEMLIDLEKANPDCFGHIELRGTLNPTLWERDPSES